MNQLSRYDKKLEHILRTSARIFAEKSYHSTSMRDIATEVPVQQVNHRPKMPAFFNIHLKQIAQVVKRRTTATQSALLLD